MHKGFFVGRMGFQPCALRCGIPLYTQIKDLDKGARLPIYAINRQPEKLKWAHKTAWCSLQDTMSASRRRAIGCKFCKRFRLPIYAINRQPENQKRRHSPSSSYPPNRPTPLPPFSGCLCHPKYNTPQHRRLRIGCATLAACRAWFAAWRFFG